MDVVEVGGDGAGDAFGAQDLVLEHEDQEAVRLQLLHGLTQEVVFDTVFPAAGAFVAFLVLTADGFPVVGGVEVDEREAVIGDGHLLPGGIDGLVAAEAVEALVPAGIVRFDGIGYDECA